MIPSVLKSVNLAPVIPDRVMLHEMACGFAEERFSLKGGMDSHWLVAAGSNVAWIETPFETPADKHPATVAIRVLLHTLKAQAYSFVSECWAAAFGPEMSDEERKHWLAFTDEHGVNALPEHLCDDALMVVSIDRDGGTSMTRYLVTLRHGKGPNFLGPRQDDDGMTGIMSGRMFNLFKSPR